MLYYWTNGKIHLPMNKTIRKKIESHPRHHWSQTEVSFQVHTHDMGNAIPNRNWCYTRVNRDPLQACRTIILGNKRQLLSTPSAVHDLTPLDSTRRTPNTDL